MIRGYWHIWATESGCRIAEQQLARLIRSGLYTATSTIVAGVLGDGRLDLPKEIVQVRHSSPEEFEHWTLRLLHRDAQAGEFDCWYIHTKGASRPWLPQDPWRDHLEGCVIDEWQWCRAQVASAGTAGPLLTFDPRPFYAGNFWWSTGRHVRTLVTPEELVAERLSRQLRPELVRFVAEAWITQGCFDRTLAEELTDVRPFSLWDNGAGLIRKTVPEAVPSEPPRSREQATVLPPTDHA